MPVITYREAIKSAMAAEMRRDERVVVMGEDIGLYGGTHLVTDGLLEQFGPKRVMDTPIAEGGFTGAAIGMAMAGMRPIVEMMTWNFSFQAADQLIQNAAKIRYFSGGQASVPLVVRGPNGGGVQLSAQHTHSLEGFYGHFPGLKVVAPATPYDAHGMMIEAIRDPDPVLILESGALYGMKGEVPEEDYTVPFGKSRIAREGTDVTLIGYGRQVNLLLKVAERLAKDEGVEAEVVDLRSIRPFDTETIVESVMKTGRAVVVEEQWRWFSVASEVAAHLQEHAFDYLDAPVERVSGVEAPAPYARNLEIAAFPGEDDIIGAVHRAQYRRS